MEIPPNTDLTAPLEWCGEEAIRFARKGETFLELTLEFGTARAKARRRDEWRTHFYANKLATKGNSAEDAFYKAIGRR